MGVPEQSLVQTAPYSCTATGVKPARLPKRRRLCRHRRRGGIGEAWSEYAVKTYQARVVWIGRRKHNSAIQEKIDRLSQFGPAPIYIEADAANPNELTRAYETIKRTHPQINGIIHSAIVLEDQSLANMPESRLKSVLAAKVNVSVNMARVFRNEPLDFALFFSSVQSFARAAGQSNYARRMQFQRCLCRSFGSSSAVFGGSDELELLGQCRNRIICRLSRTDETGGSRIN